jgi:ATP:ADP antiporter, AAA family
MKNPLLHNTGVKGNEFLIFFLTCIQALLTSAFLVTFDIGAHVIFFQTHNSQMIPQALIISGIMGLIYMSLYTFFSNRVHFRFFVLSNYFIILLVLATYYFYEPFRSASLFGVPLLMPLTLMFPVTIITMLVFRRSLRNLFTPHQNRRMYPYIRGFQIAGMIIAAALLLAFFFFQWDRNLMMLASVGLMVVITGLQMIMNVVHRFSPVLFHPMKKLNPIRSKFTELFYSRFTLLLLTFVIISTVIGYLIYYQFISLARETYPDIRGFSKFLALFMIVMFIFEYIVEKVLIRKILYSYDSPYSLVLIPAGVGLAIIATILINLLAGSSATINRFTYVFLMITMIRIGYYTMRESIELPSLKVLFRTLDFRFHNVIIPRVEGGFRMAGVAVTGLLITGLLYIGLEKEIFQNIIILILSAAWLFIAIKLIKAYQKALTEGIRKLKSNVRQIEQELISTDEKAHSLINHNDPKKVITALSLFERIEPIQHENHLISLLASSSFEIKKYLLAKIEEYSVINALPIIKESPSLKENQSKETAAVANHLVNRFEAKLSLGTNREEISQLSNSLNITDRILAAEITGALGKTEWNDIVLSLSRDIEPEVKASAVRAMARLNCAEHSHVLIGYLSTPYFFPFAFEALIKIGDPALDILDQVFLQSDADNTMLSRIIRIYGKIGSPKAIDLLLTKIENQNRYLTRQAILSLREAKFQATPSNINRILNTIIRLITTMAWNFSVYQVLEKSKRFPFLLEAFDSEIKDNYNTLYNLLSLAYNTASIGNIRNLITEGDDTDISYAIEMLDHILNEEIKQVFFPVIENLSIKSRVKQLEYFFQSDKSDPEDLINEIIIRDFNSISFHTKACAIFSLLQIRNPGISQELIAMLFHPDRIFQESASYVIHQIDGGFLQTIYPRLEQAVILQIQNSLERSLNKRIPYLLLEKIRFLKGVKKFRDINEDVLLEICRHLDQNQMAASDQLLIKKNDVHYPLIIVYNGQAEVRNSVDKVFIFNKNDIIYSDIYSINEAFSFRAITDLEFYNLDQEMFNNLAFDNLEFRKLLFELIEESKA